MPPTWPLTPVVPVAQDGWAALRQHTPARIALGRVGDGLPTAEALRFAAAHAQARDAVHVPLDVAAMAAVLHADGWPTLAATSRAATRDVYLRRPDLGRRLDADSASSIEAAAAGQAGCELAIVVADGLSAVAAQQHAAPLLRALRGCLTLASAGAAPLRTAPVVIATQARVALADEVGALLKARVVVMLLGERPGLSSPDSLGAYLTFEPHVGRSDAERNCLSNIRPEGLPLEPAAARLAWLVHEALRRRVSGVALKDDSSVTLLGQAAG